jgi:hypothetical protein
MRVSSMVRLVALTNRRRVSRRRPTITPQIKPI